MIKKYGLYAVIAVLLVTASYLIYHKLTIPGLPENLIAGSGRIDGDIIGLNTKYPGRILELTVHEGQHIKKKEIIAVLQSDEHQAKLKAIDQAIAAAQEGLAALKQEYGIAQQSIPLEISKAEHAEKIARAQKTELDKQVASMEAVVQQDRADYNRTLSLFDKHLIAKQKVELAELKLTDSTNNLAALLQKTLQARQGIKVAQNNIALARAQERRLLAIAANIKASMHQISLLTANKEELQIVIDQMSIASPVDGNVIEKVAQPGEVLGAGSVVVTLIDPQTLHLKMFVDTMDNGKIKIGNEAVIFVDAYPDKPFKAHVTRIEDKAEFTPKDVNIRNDRIQRMYAVYIMPDEAEPLFKVGLPAIGVVSIDGAGLPGSLRDIPEL